jgi:hypothetical protein
MNTHPSSPNDLEETPSNADAIPVLDSAVDSENLDPLEPTTELDVDLGYALEAEGLDDADNLTEMDEIQTLPMAEALVDDTEELAIRQSEKLLSDDQRERIATLEAIVFEGYDPQHAEAVQQPFAPLETAPIADTGDHAMPIPAEPPIVEQHIEKVEPGRDDVSPTKKSENPFLPQHILDRLNQGKRNLVEEIAQSSAALDASTAILRTHARAERLHKPVFTETKTTANFSFSRDRAAQQKQKIVDELVDDYLPLLAAELRRRLRKLLDEQFP